METLRIGLVGLNTFPIPPPTHTGDIVIMHLGQSLEEMGHEVDFYAPAGSWKPSRGDLLEMPCSWGAAYPPMWECEQTCFDRHAAVVRGDDVVHDFSHYKRFAENIFQGGRTNVVSTLLGGAWAHPDPPWNIVVWSEAMRRRGLRGATDYEGTPTPDLAGPPQRPIKDAHVVYGGVDTDYYCPGKSLSIEEPSRLRPAAPLKSLDESLPPGERLPFRGFYLWMNRWHPAKGYKVAIELAKRTGIPLVMAGDPPELERFEYQANCAREAMELAKGVPNVRFEWLPADPDHHDAKRELYRRAKALLYTIQFQEPFGLAQVESLACGTPVIGLNYGSVPEVITHKKTGYVCDNLVQMVIAISLVDDSFPFVKGTIESDVCREEAVRRFDRRVMAKAYLEEYRKVMDGAVWGR